MREQGSPAGLRMFYQEAGLVVETAAVLGLPLCWKISVPFMVNALPRSFVEAMSCPISSKNGLLIVFSLT